MTLGHFIYIPGILLLGIIIGYVMGGRAAAAVKEDRAERDQRKAAREARRRAAESD
jgi:proteasome assembly chaperone (PAC2) family protein